MKELRVFVKVYEKESGEYVDGFDSYLNDRDHEDIDGRWEMVEMELGSLQRRLEKKLLDNQK